MLTLNDGRKELYQWDTGRTATVDIECDVVHFANLKYGESLAVEVKGGKVAIPNKLLMSGEPIYCWAFVKDENGAYTKKEQTFVVTKRAKPSDYVYTETDVITVKTAVDKDLEEAKERGDFKGEKGDKGDPREVVQEVGQSETAVMSQKATTDELMNKLPKSPINWEPWTADEQAAARERMAVENGADFELLVDATLEEEANIFKVVFPKPVRECIYHIWFYNNNGESVIARTKCFDYTGVNGFYLLKYTSNIKDSCGYVLNGYLRYNGPIMGKSVIGYAADAQATSWTTDAPGNGTQAFLNYPTATILIDVSGLSVELDDKTHVLNAGATIKVWGR